MTPKEWSAAQAYAQTLTQSQFKFFMDELNDFGHFEMGKPRADLPWNERFEIWKRNKEGGDK